MNNYLDKFKGAYQDNFPYLLDNKLMLNWYPERILKQATGQSLLELGIGHGYSTVKFSERFNRHLVLEGSLAIINNFVKEFPECNAKILHSTFENFYTEEKFDIIIMGFILEHVDDPSFILTQYKHYLCPKGSIFIAVPNAEALNKRFGYEAGIINSMSDLSQNDIALGHKRLFTVKTLKDLVESQGYRAKILEGIFLKPITTQQIIDLKLSDNILKAMLKVGVDYPELCVGILMEIEVAE